MYAKSAWLPHGEVYNIAYCPTCACIVRGLRLCCKDYFGHAHPLAFITLVARGERAVVYEMEEWVPAELRALVEELWVRRRISAPTVEYLLAQALEARAAERKQ